VTAFDDARAAVLADLVGRRAVERLFAADHTLWREDPNEVADRLGWIPVVDEVRTALPELAARCDALVDDVDDVVVMGMGGSSLFPEVLARSLEPGPGRPRLHVLDTTDPAAIERIADTCPPGRTLHVASSKSGSTIETRSHLEWAWARAAGSGRFAVITDPGSELGALARERGFADVFENRADIGGRYAALSLFGIVPALLMGADAEALLQGGREALDECGPHVAPEANPALTLAAAIAGGVQVARDKLTIVLEPEVATLGLWIEQLIAESLGKDGTGVVPVVDEPLGAPEVYGPDRLFLAPGPLADLEAAGHPVVALRSSAAPHDLGHLVVTMELATALVGAALGVQPFDQPDVAAAKEATSEVLAQGGAEVEELLLADLLVQVGPDDHLAIQAFVDPGSHEAEELEATRALLRDRLRVAVTLGFGPRFLHSTGQLHKGGPRAIVCVQVATPSPGEDIPIPGRDFGFGHLKAAQAAGDLRTLLDRGVRAGRVALDDLLEVQR
jgi:transaldolase / glucose-6-phosphate isomerase